MTKKRAMITVDSDQWDRVQELLDDNGYPSGSMSLYLRLCVRQLEKYLTYDGELPIPVSPSSPIADLEISKIGLDSAADRFGWILEEWEADLSDSVDSEK